MSNKFLTQIGYQQQAKEYLSERALSIDNERLRILSRAQATSCKAFYVAETNLINQVSYRPFIPEGWAFCIRQPMGGFPVDNLLIRPCNWPEKDLYQLERDKATGVISYIPVDKPPKFLYEMDKSYLGDSTYWASTLPEITGQDFLVIAEKYVVATLIASNLRVPALGLSGCWNYSEGGEITSSLSAALMALKGGATVVVIFDADIATNAMVMKAGRKFKNMIRRTRPDLKVKFLAPLGEAGIDDWWVEQGPDAAALFEQALAGEGVEVSSVYAMRELVLTCGVTFETRKKRDVPEHTSANYRNLILNLPEFNDLVRDNISGDYYMTREYNKGCLSGDQIHTRISILLETMVYYDNPHISRQTLRDVLKGEIIPARTRSVLLDIIDDVLPLPDMSMERANVVAFLAAAGISGPMTMDELVEIFLRLARDIVHTWADSGDYHIENFLGLSGPSGVGKTKLLDNMFAQLANRCCKTGKQGKLTTTFSPGGDIDKFTKLVSICCGVVIDELNPKRRAEGEILHAIYSTVTDNSYKVRDAYAMDESWHPLHALIALTTVDDKYIVGDMDAGAKRRLIPLQLSGAIRNYDGELRPDHVAIAEHFFQILACARFRMLNGEDLQGNVSAYSAKYVEDVFDAPSVVKSISHNWAKDMEQLHEELIQLGKDQQDKSGNVRFTMAMLLRTMSPNSEPRGSAYDDFAKFAQNMGAVKMGGSSNNVKNIKGPVRNAYVIEGGERGWQAYVEKLLSRLP